MEEMRNIMREPCIWHTPFTDTSRYSTFIKSNQEEKGYMNQNEKAENIEEERGT